MTGPYAHMEAIALLKKWQDEAVNFRSAHGAQSLINPTLIHFGKEIERLMAEVESAVKQGDVKLKDVLFAQSQQKAVK